MFFISNKTEKAVASFRHHPRSVSTSETSASYTQAAALSRAPTLKGRDARFDLLSGAPRVGVFYGDAFGQWLYANKGSQEITEFRTEDCHGEGSTFWFTIPPKKQDSACRQILPTTSGFPNSRALVISESAMNREILQAQLAAWKVASGAVSDGPDARSALRRVQENKTPYHLAVSTWSKVWTA
jgi:hypothetical protein